MVGNLTKSRCVKLSRFVCGMYKCRKVIEIIVVKLVRTKVIIFSFNIQSHRQMFRVYSLINTYKRFDISDVCFLVV